MLDKFDNLVTVTATALARFVALAFLTAVGGLALLMLLQLAHYTGIAVAVLDAVSGTTG